VTILTFVIVGKTKVGGLESTHSKAGNSFGELKLLEIFFKNYF